MQTKNKLIPLAAGVLVIISTILNLFNVFDYIRYDIISTFGGLLLVLNIFSNLILVASLFMNNKKIALIPMAFNVLSSFIYLIQYISLINLLYVVIDGIILVTLLSTTILTGQIDKKIIKYICFVPAIISFLIFGFDFLKIIFDGYFSFYTLLYILRGIIGVFTYLFIGLWASETELSKDMFSELVAGKDTNSSTTSSAENVASSLNINLPLSGGYCDMLTHILLLLFTFGIWQLVWVYKTTAFLNDASNEEQRDPTIQLVLCMFVPFYMIYWVYQSASRIDKLAASKGQQSDIATLCLILAFFIGIVPPVIMQDKLNNIVKPNSTTNASASNNNVPNAHPYGGSTTNNSAPETSAQPAPSTGINIPEEIRKYKELLDAGIITEEEFEAKKKQLLGI